MHSSPSSKTTLFTGDGGCSYETDHLRSPNLSIVVVQRIQSGPAARIVSRAG